MGYGQYSLYVGGDYVTQAELRVQAFYAGFDRDWIKTRKTAHNECTLWYEDKIVVMYYSTPILVVDLQNKKIIVRNGGFNSNSTHRHINNAADRLRDEVGWMPGSITGASDGHGGSVFKVHPWMAFRKTGQESVFCQVRPFGEWLEDHERFGFNGRGHRGHICTEGVKQTTFTLRQCKEGR